MIFTEFPIFHCHILLKIHKRFQKTIHIIIILQAVADLRFNVWDGAFFFKDNHSKNIAYSDKIIVFPLDKRMLCTHIY